MADNGTDKNPWGQTKEHAWAWILKEYGIVAIFWLILFVGAICNLVLYGPGFWMIIVFLILSGFPIALIVYVPKWYRQLVDQNYILPFNRSKFKDIFKKK